MGIPGESRVKSQCLGSLVLSRMFHMYTVYLQCKPLVTEASDAAIDYMHVEPRSVVEKGAHAVPVNISCDPNRDRRA